MTARLRLQLPSMQWAIISVLITIVAVVAASTFLVGADALLVKLRRFDFITLGLCIILVIWQVGCRFLRWFIFARSLSLKISAPEAALYYGAAFGVTLTPGRLGEALRLWFLEQRLAVPYRRIGGLYLADRVSDATAYLVLLAIGSAGYPQRSPIAWGTPLLVAAVIVVIMHPRPILAVLTACYAIVGRGKYVVAWLRRAVRNASILFAPGIFLPGLAIGTAGWFAAPVVLMLSLRQLGIDFKLLHATAIYAIAALSGGSSMMPGGVGATEAVLVLLLRASQVPLDDAILATLMTRLGFLWLPVGAGIALLPVALWKVRSNRLVARV